MKKFISHFIKLLLLSVLLLIALDFVYTKMYSSSIYNRSKVSWVNNISNEMPLDYAVFGSSRAAFHINPKQILQTTNQLGVNLAYPAATNLEIKLMVQHFLKTHPVKRIFIQVDKLYNTETIDPIAITPWMPYIRTDYVYNEIKKQDALAFFKKYLPFYRYMLYDSKLGFRELSMGFVKNNKMEENLGFLGINGTMKKEDTFRIKALVNKKNIHLLEILEICKKNEISCYFFTAPYYQTDFNTEVLKENLPNYIDFSKSINNISMFNDYQHLNLQGAKAFTDLFQGAYFENKN
ncbi:hypothetical protein FG167_00620 [Lacinutrix sp. WUR7]|uniref:hypothetical protein n=1 Tax=Lacinutrix sp. WUR7 TaxID=2653681 RepID=UPI00193D6AE8|nr:hypothetical protein [Lacinutrix sp. WUR7]QRM87782.1 hypothetical protein FG167_00620 [Lacinutrix sp. WUR7]